MVPKLRFRDFKEHWESKYLGDITSKIGSGSTPKGGADVYQLTGIPFIRSQNVYNEQLNLKDLVFISSDIDEKMKGSRVKSGDILLNITGASIGRSCVVPENFKQGNVNQHVCIIRLLNNSPKFFQAFISSDKGQKLIDNSQSGSGREGLNFENIRNFLIYSPPVIEQTKIADFLSSVDEKIALLNKQYNLLCQYKKGMMQKIFSQELRFKDKNGEEFSEWGEATLDSIGSFFSGGTPTSTNRNYYNGIIPFIRSAEINSDLTELFISEEGLNSSSAKLVNKGDILYALYGATSGEVGISKINGAINQAILCIRSTLNTNFLYYFLKSSKEKIVATYIQGGQGNLSAEIIKKLIVPTPSAGEQTKIANFLATLDEKISAQKAELNKLKTWKQGLLQQMFV